MLRLKNWDAYARGQAPRWVRSEGALATALLFVSRLFILPMGAADGFPELRQEGVFAMREGVLYMGGRKGGLRPVQEQGEGLRGWGGPGAVVVGEPSDHFGLCHLECGLVTQGFLSRETGEGALGHKYTQLAWDLRQAWGVVWESTLFLYADGSVIVRWSPVPLCKGSV